MNARSPKTELSKTFFKARLMSSEVSQSSHKRLLAPKKITFGGGRPKALSEKSLTMKGSILSC
jgi:hypothetical protein